MSVQTSRTVSCSRNKTLQLLGRGLAILMLGIWLTQVIPGATHRAYAAPLEDCDLDGFDDATGVPVPWPGYDETHGDTSAGPGTADWWVKQNQSAGSSGSGSGSTSGSDSNPSGSGGSSSSGTGTSKNTGGGSGSGGSKSSSSGSGTGAAVSGTSNVANTATSGTKTDAPAAVSTAVEQSATASGGATSAPVSAITSASSEANNGASDQETSGNGGTSTSSGSLWDALTVGFRGDTHELFAGLSLLGALALAGVLSTGMSSLPIRPRRRRV